MNEKVRYYQGEGPGQQRSFVMFPQQLINSPRFHALSAHAVKNLMYLAGQFRGSNNGDLAIAWKVAQTKGITSNSMLRLDALELLKAGFIVQIGAPSIEGPAAYGLNALSGMVSVVGGAMDPQASNGFVPQ